MECSSCRIEPAVAGRRSCQSCLARRRQAARQLAAARRQAGLCGYCGRHPAPETYACLHCRLKRRRCTKQALHAAQPTKALPGSPTKLALLRQRADLHLDLHVQGDQMSEYAREGFRALNGLLKGLWNES